MAKRYPAASVRGTVLGGTARVADAILQRMKNGRNFGIVAIAEGAMSLEDAAHIRNTWKSLQKAIDREKNAQAGQGNDTHDGSRAR